MSCLVAPDPCPHPGEVEPGWQEGGREGGKGAQHTGMAKLHLPQKAPGTHQGCSGDLGQVKEEEEEKNLQDTALRNLCVLGL